MKRPLAILSLALIATTSLAACGGSSGGEPAASADIIEKTPTTEAPTTTTQAALAEMSIDTQLTVLSCGDLLFDSAMAVMGQSVYGPANDDLDAMQSECDDAMRRMDIEASEVEGGYLQRSKITNLIQSAQGRVYHISVEMATNGGACDDTCQNGGRYRSIDNFATLTDDLEAEIEGR